MTHGQKTRGDMGDSSAAARQALQEEWLDGNNDKARRSTRVKILTIKMEDDRDQQDFLLGNGSLSQPSQGRGS